MARKEGRLSRWSTLKSKGGASPEENDAARKAAETTPRPTTDAPSPPSPSGDLAYTGQFSANPYKRPPAPVMAPLGGVEEDDDAFLGAPEAALAMLNGDSPDRSGDDTSDATAADTAGDADEPELTEEEKEAVAGLPAIETLTQDSDFTPFMADKIPEFIRRKALKVLYQSHPILGFRDGLNDYDDDYNLIHTLIDAATQSSYIVGKGQTAARDADPLPETGAETEPETETEVKAETETVAETEMETDTESRSQATEGDEGAPEEPSPEAADPTEGKVASQPPEPQTAGSTDSEDQKAPSPQTLRDVRKPDGPDPKR